MLGDEIQIIIENQNYLALNKPSQLHSVGIKGGRGGSSLADLLIDRDPNFKHYSLKPEDGGLINRLDYETSGVIIAAKSREAWELGRAAIQDGRIFKSYLAYVDGLVEPSFKIESYLGSPYRGSKKVKVYTKKPGKRARALNAMSEIALVKYSKERDLSLVRIIAHTARRHQIRAHLSFNGHPLTGDRLYGSKRDLSATLGCTAPPFFLHSEKIQFRDELNGETFEAMAESPYSSMVL